MPEKSVAELLEELRPDPWRSEVGFGADIALASSQLLEPGITEGEAVRVLNDWLQKHQPCLFGRLAAKSGLISYCILTPADLLGSEEAIQDKIQESRTRWTREGFEGRKSGFVILAISPTIAFAVPDAHMKLLAQRLCSLYLLEPIPTDQVFLDELFLEVPGGSRMTWRWHAGVNYFCAQGDGRWWQDHRVPGGMAFSVNSVGHMAKSGRLALAMKDFNTALGIPVDDGGKDPKIESLPTALEFAMRTIAIASEAVSGKATALMPLPTDPTELPVPKCPVELPAFLRDKNFCSYEGYYHTDYTLPSEYFEPDVKRPEWVKARELDFTYLFVNELANPAFTTMGSGRRIRHATLSTSPSQSEDQVPRASKTLLMELPIDQCKRLMRALDT